MFSSVGLESEVQFIPFGPETEIFVQMHVRSVERRGEEEEMRRGGNL